MQGIGYYRFLTGKTLRTAESVDRDWKSSIENCTKA